MNNRSNGIKNILANLVTNVALGFPVVYINTISLFSQGNLLATCNWDSINDTDAGCYLDQTQPAFLTIYHDFNEFNEVEIVGVDIDGKEFKLFSNAADVLNRKAA